MSIYIKIVIFTESIYIHNLENCLVPRFPESTFPPAHIHFHCVGSLIVSFSVCHGLVSKNVTVQHSPWQFCDIVYCDSFRSLCTLLH